MGVIILGVFALNTQGIEGGVIQMVNHGIVIAALFLIAGYIETRTGSRRLADFGGLAARVPWLATVFLIVALAALGLPGLNSFAGEFLAFLGAFRFNVVAGGLGTLVVIPAAWYMLRFFQGVMHGPEKEMALAGGGMGGAAVAANGTTASSTRTAALADLRLGELATLLPLLVLIFYLGLAPAILSTRMETSVAPLTATAAPVTAARTRAGDTVHSSETLIQIHPRHPANGGSI
jgi:NADH-quinone oxidoreductase subunit M